MIAEFSRKFPLDSLGSVPRRVSIDATETERSAIAARFDLAALNALAATATLTASQRGVDVVGRLAARLVQNCVVTGDPVVTTIDEPFSLRFVEADQLASDNEETELSETDCDLIAIDRGTIDLGEAVAQTLGLALDPFPRSPAERARENERKWVAGEDAGPFANLKGLLGS